MLHKVRDFVNVNVLKCSYVNNQSIMNRLNHTLTILAPDGDKLLALSICDSGLLHHLL